MPVIHSNNCEGAPSIPHHRPGRFDRRHCLGRPRRAHSLDLTCHVAGHGGGLGGRAARPPASRTQSFLSHRHRASLPGSSYCSWPCPPCRLHPHHRPFRRRPPLRRTRYDRPRYSPVLAPPNPNPNPNPDPNPTLPWETPVLNLLQNSPQATPRPGRPFALRPLVRAVVPRLHLPLHPPPREPSATVNFPGPAVALLPRVPLVLSPLVPFDPLVSRVSLVPLFSHFPARPSAAVR